MVNYKISTIVLSVIAVLFFCTSIYYATHQQIKYNTVTKYDTTYLHTVDTVTVTKSDIVYKNTIVLDTIYIKDTSLVVEKKVYEDTISTVYFQGINAFIDSIEYRLPKDTVIVSSETEHSIQQKDSFWKNRFVVTAGIYAGYGLINRQPDVYVGLGFGVRLY